MHKTILDYFRDHVEKGRFLFEIETQKKITFKEIYQGALCRGKELMAYDQKIISVILPNSCGYIEYYLATIATNNIFNPIPYFVSVPELEKILMYLQPAVIVTDRQDILDYFQEKFLCVDPNCARDGTPCEVKDVDINKPAALYYSSGTTGNPKGVLYSHKNMTSLISSIIRGFHFDSSDNQLAFLPFGHTASINYNILPSLMVGCNLYISKGFENLRTNFFDVLSRYRISYTEVVPTVILMLLKLNVDINNCDLRDLRFIGCGSSTLPLVSQKEFINRYGIKVANLYGLSETGPSHIDYPLVKGWEPGSIGIPLDVNECKIAQDGEIILKGDNIFIGYYKNEKAYQDAVKDGWFYTGDMGDFHDGKYYFVDRKKDLIIKGGINIVPMEVEEVLYKHPNVHECIVVGQKNEILGEDVVAVLKAKQKCDNAQFIKELQKICMQELSSYKVPSKILIWPELPKTHSNKLLRRNVREIINKN